MKSVRGVVKTWCWETETGYETSVCVGGRGRCWSAVTAFGKLLHCGLTDRGQTGVPRRTEGSYTPLVSAARTGSGPGGQLPDVELPRCCRAVGQAVSCQPTPGHTSIQPGRSSPSFLLLLLLPFPRLAFLFLARCLQWLLFVGLHLVGFLS